MELSRIPSLLPNPFQMEQLFDELWPICRSITGNGFRQSLEILRKIIPLETIEFPSGQKVFDWTIPKEWNIDDAYLEDEHGTKIVEFKKNNLHVLSYSIPIDQWLSLEELQPHLHSLPELPHAVPYLTSYYQERWGFCLSQIQRRELKPGKYHAVIRSRHVQGSLTIGHHMLPATEKTDQEVLLTSYLCHPSMANNELSGPLVLAFLYDALRRMPERRFNYRFVINPETIGALAYLSEFGNKLKNSCQAGLVITCCGDGKLLSFKKTRRGNSDLDRIFSGLLKKQEKKFQILPFSPAGGSDERQYCSPGFNLPVGVFMNSTPGEFPEYHTSLDDKSVVSFKAMKENVSILLELLSCFEGNKKYTGTVLYGEPMLGARGLYPTLGSQRTREEFLSTLMWVLNYSDGNHDLCAIAEAADLPFTQVLEAAKTLETHGLIRSL